MAGSPAGRFRGGGKDQSKGHSAQNVWEEAPMGKPWQVWPLEMPGLTDRPKEPLPWWLHSPLLPAQPLTQLCLKVLQNSFGCPWLCYLHGIVTLAPTGSALMQDLSLNCHCELLKSDLAHPGIWFISVVTLRMPGLCKSCSLCALWGSS